VVNPPLFLLATKSKTLNDLLVPRLFRRPQIFQQAATTTNQLQQASAGMMILLVCLEMIRQVRDALGEKSDLNLWRTRVTFMGGVCLHQFSLSFSGHGHFLVSFFSFQQVTSGWLTAGCRLKR